MHGELPAMKEAEEQPSAIWWKAPARQWTLLYARTRGQVFLVLTLLIGALVGAIVVAFILVTERFGARLYPAGGAANAIKTNENRSVRTGHGELENRRTYQKATQNQ